MSGQQVHQRKKVLWLVSWYPNKYDPFDGDFIQRHARAAALYDDVHVLFVKQSEEQEEVEEAQRCENGLTEQIIYLPKSKGTVGRLRNHHKWWLVYRKKVGQCIEQFKPQLIHVHVPWKAGLIALWAKNKYELPYILTEHWGIYNRVVSDNIYTRSVFFRTFLKKIYSEAKSFVSVSHFLGEAVNGALVKKEFSVIPNVVNTALFFPGDEKPEHFTFLHVSNMAPLKNVEGILSAFRQFLEQTSAEVQLLMVGNRDEQYPQLAQEMGLLGKSVFFKGEIEYAEVAKQMQQAQVFVLNSDMENSPCVIGEALCCGLPVIATKVGGVPELVSAENSVLVPSRNEQALAEAMVKMYREYSRYERKRIATTSHQKFSPVVIGNMHHGLYT